MRLLHLAQQSPDKEICGLIGSVSTGLPRTCYPVTNIASDPHRQFQLDPRQQIQSMKKMRENDESLYAIYHSHPTTPALPSAADLEHVGYPNAYYLIISLSTKGILEIRAYRFSNNVFKPVPLNMTDS